MNKRPLLIALAALLTLANEANADSLDKLSPYVREALNTVNNGTNATRSAIADSRSICVFVRIDGEEAVEALEDNGCRILDRRGDIAIADVPLTQLATLTLCDAIGRIEAERPGTTAMDTTTTIVNALPAYSGQGLPQAFTGKGVMVGVADIGFDLTHPTFFDATGTNYRITALWDLLSPDTVGSTLYVGRDYVGSEALLNYAHTADAYLTSHGTHAAGIAVGAGFGSPYRGVAFESDICMAGLHMSNNAVLIDSADLYKYTNTTIGLAFKYIFDHAESQGKPCVLSYSAGIVFSFSENNKLFQQYLASLTGPGRIIVASAGNKSTVPAFVAKPAGKETAGAFLASSSNTATMVITADGPFSLSAITYGDNATQTTTINMADLRGDTTIAMPLPGDSIRIIPYTNAYAEGDSAYEVYVKSSQPINSHSPLAIVVGGAESNVEVMAVVSAYFQNGTADATWSDAETSHNVNIPAAFDGIIAVGATIHRTDYTNFLGQQKVFSQSGRTDGVRAYYSSIGPGVSGATKPDVVAPGTNIISSYSSYYLAANPTASEYYNSVERFAHNGRTYAWNASTGTSMATPVVSGAIALWLQAKPGLTTEEALEAISLTSRHPEEGMEYPNNYYGHGEIDVYKGLLHILNLTNIDGLSTAQPQGAKIGITADGQLRLTFDQEPTAPITLTVYSLDGKPIYTCGVETAGGKEATIAPPLNSQTVYAVQLTSADPTLTGSTLIRTM